MTSSATQTRAVLRIAINPSRYLLAFIVGTHGLVIVVIWLIALPWLISAALSVAIVVSLLISVYRHVWRGERVLTLTEGRWQLHSNGRVVNVVPRAGYFVTPWLIILPLDREPKRLTSPNSMALVLLPDSADMNELRQLRVILKSY